MQFFDNSSRMTHFFPRISTMEITSFLIPRVLLSHDLIKAILSMQDGP